MTAESLEVWLEGRRAGQLAVAGGTLVFTYAADYQADPHATPLSLSMPLDGPACHEGGPAHLFFAGLLPEGRVLEYVARQHRISESNVFGLLEAIGGDCAGAVSVIPADTEGDGASPYHEPMDARTLAKLLAELPRWPVRPDHGGIRLSLAGAQNKLPVAFHDGDYALPHGAAASTHILKPAMAVHEDFAWATVENEAFCLALARRVGLPVPRSGIVDLGGPVLMLARYDRVWGDDAAGHAGFSSVRRVHQEDFCQAMALPPSAKYENEGGPGFAACVECVRRHADVPVRDGGALLRWLVFNYLIGNADAHAKNLSFLLRGAGVELAPFYDLMSTAVYPDHAGNMAMKIGGQYDPAWLVRAEYWKRGAEDAGVRWPSLRRTLTEMATAVATHAPSARAEVEDQVGAPVDLLGAISDEVIARNADRLIALTG
ncbi:type II toxin-antitoxin system HipA family toxin [Halofilum ochraceum]|uniref:type II toxin-antitoxin system HipA family toxin n=1 Tax=Halofilum ochraceum TaxID=1611323 RepID=UPI0008DA7074|nr:type II toxin-antitoxin system HipA family toxin [Halofilum ochraceum]